MKQSSETLFAALALQQFPVDEDLSGSHFSGLNLSASLSSSPARSGLKGRPTSLFIAVGAGLCLFGSSADAAKKTAGGNEDTAVPKTGTVITSTGVPISIHDIRNDGVNARPDALRLTSSRLMSPVTVRQVGSRPLFMQPLVQQSFSTSPRLAQNIPNSPAAKPVENPPGLQVPVGPDKDTPAAPNAPADNPPAGTPPAADKPAETPPVITPDTPTTPPQTTPGEVNPEFEGRQIAEVRVVGNRVVPETSILLQVTTQRGAALSSRQLDIDRTKIDALGFFASVEHQVTQNLEDPAKVDVTFIVIENRVISGFQFVGATQVKTEELEKTLKSQKGSVLSRPMVQLDVEAIQRLYREKGFAVVVTESRQLENGTLLFVVQEGKISRIDLSGLKKTAPGLVRKQIRTKPGDTFDQTKVRADLNRIYDMGFFDDVSFKVTDDTDKPGSIIVTMILKEKRTGQLSLGVGFDNRSKITGFFNVGENNFRGSGKHITLGAEIGSRQTFEVGYGNPFVGPKNASYDISAFTRIIYREPRAVATVVGGQVNTALNYEEHRTGVRLNFTSPLDLDHNTALLFGIRSERAKLYQVDITTNTPVPVALPQNASGGVTGLSIGFQSDKRDLRLDPSKGSRIQLIAEQGVKILGGSNSFTKVDLDLRHYIPLIGPAKVSELPKLVLAGRAVIGHSFGQLPAFEQYFIGGTDTVRGYDVDEQYGDNQYYGNIELRLRLQRKFQIVAFSDVGQADGGPFSSQNSDLLYSVGAGVRVQTPLGPIRLDIGFGRDGARTHFGIGSTF